MDIDGHFMFALRHWLPLMSDRHAQANNGMLDACTQAVPVVSHDGPAYSLHGVMSKYKEKPINWSCQWPIK